MLRDKIDSQVTVGPASKSCVGVNACQPVKLRTLPNPPVPLVGMLTLEISRSQTPHCRQDAARLIEGIGILLVSSSRNQDTVVQTSSAQLTGSPGYTSGTMVGSSNARRLIYPKTVFTSTTLTTSIQSTHCFLSRSLGKYTHVAVSEWSPIWRI